MQRKSVRIMASLIFSVMLLALPLGAVLANSNTVTLVCAEEGTEETTENRTDISGNDETSAGEDGVEEENPRNENGEGDGSESENEVTPTPEPTPEPECICDHRCSKYDYNHDCPVCGKDFNNCGYQEPNVRITIKEQDGWFPAGVTVRVKFKAEDILDTGNFEIKSVKVRIGQNGTYRDVTEDMYIDISENCTVYVMVTDAHDKSYERSRAIKCFDTGRPTLNAAVSEGLLTVKAVDTESGVAVIYVNGYEFTDITNGTVNIRLSQFDAGYEYFTITAMDNAGNVSEVYKTKNPYYKDPDTKENDNPAAQLPVSAEATQPSQATAQVTQHTTTDSSGNTTSQTPKTPEQEKREEFARADAEEAAMREASRNDDRNSEDMGLGKEFYTIEAASGKVFYLIIDRNGQEEMVYFLTEITENDLLNVTTNNSETLPKNSAALESQIPVTESALPNNNTDDEGTHEVKTPAPTEGAEDTEAEGAGPEEPETEESETEKTAKSNPLAGYLIMGVFGVGVIGCAYYFKVVKKKQDGDFVEDEEEAEEEVYPDDPEEEKDEDEDFINGEDQEYPEPTKEQKDRPAPTAEDAEDAS